MTFLIFFPNLLTFFQFCYGIQNIQVCIENSNSNIDFCINDLT